MRKFIDSQVKSKDERVAEKEASRAAKAERLATRDAEKAELERQNGEIINYPVLTKDLECSCCRLRWCIRPPRNVQISVRRDPPACFWSRIRL